MTGCSVGNSTLNKLEPTVTLDTSDIKESSTEDIINSNNSEKSNIVKYTKAMNNSIKKYYSQYTYGVITETISNGIDVNQPQSNVIYTIKVDTKNKFTELICEINGEQTSDTLHDYVNDATYILKNDKWTKKTGTFTILDWDMSKFSSIYDVYEYLLGDYQISVGTEGISNDTVFNFTEESNKVNKKALSGVEYDKLISQTKILAIEIKDDMYTPISNLVDIEYSKDANNYFCRTSFVFSDLSKTTVLESGDEDYASD
jgi:hypothetical protein